MTKEQKDFIKNLSNEIKTQDTRGTATPYGLVIGQKRVVVTHGDFASNKAIFGDDGAMWDTFEEFRNYLIENDGFETLIFLRDESIDTIGEIAQNKTKISKILGEDIRVYGYNTEEDFYPNGVGGNFFLTDKSAKEYVERNKHNLNEPFTYGIHLYRNSEMSQLIEVIHAMAEDMQ